MHYLSSIVFAVSFLVPFISIFFAFKLKVPWIISIILSVVIGWGLLISGDYVYYEELIQEAASANDELLRQRIARDTSSTFIFLFGWLPMLIWSALVFMLYVLIRYAWKLLSQNIKA